MAGARGLWAPGGTSLQPRAPPMQVQVVMGGRSVGQRLVPVAHPWVQRAWGPENRVLTEPLCTSGILKS